MSFDPQLFSIGEFSQISGLSVKALRFYDEKGVLKPAQVDATTGYRYYDGASLERARIVARLRELQFSLDDIVRILAEVGDEGDLLERLARQHQLILERLRTDRKVARALAEMIAQEKAAEKLAGAATFAVEEK